MCARFACPRRCGYAGRVCWNVSNNQSGLKRSFMKLIRLLYTLTLLSGAVIAQAHTHLQKSNPADGSVVSTSPSHVVLTFSESARVTAAWIQKNDGPKEKLGPLPDKSSPDATLALPTLTPGTYLVSWRAAGNDGHVMPGQLHFTVSAGGESKGSQQQ